MRWLMLPCLCAALCGCSASESEEPAAPCAEEKRACAEAARALRQARHALSSFNSANGMKAATMALLEEGAELERKIDRASDDYAAAERALEQCRREHGLVSSSPDSAPKPQPSPAETRQHTSAPPATPPEEFFAEWLSSRDTDGGGEYERARRVVTGAPGTTQRSRSFAVQYTIEGMGGGNNYVRRTAVFTQQADSWRYIGDIAVFGKFAPIEYQLKTIDDGAIIFDVRCGFHYRPQCAQWPLGEGARAAFVLDGDRLTPTENTFTLFADLADKVYERGEKRHGAVLYEHALGLCTSPGHRVRAYGSLAQAHYDLGHREKAHRYCDELLSLEPDNRWARGLMAKLR